MKRRWHRFAIPLGVVALIFTVTGVAYAVNEPDPSDPDFLSPISAAAIGGQRLADALADRGVHVAHYTRTSDALVSAYDGDATLFLPVPRVIHPDYLDMLRLMPASTRIVLVDPNRQVLDDASIPLTPAGRRWAARAVPPGCALAEALAAGTAAAHRQRYQGGGLPCYGAGVVRLTPQRAEVVVVGASDPFRNDRFGEHGNAMLATGLLAAHPRVIWLDLHELEKPPGTSGEPGSSTGVPPSFGSEREGGEPVEGEGESEGSFEEEREEPEPEATSDEDPPPGGSASARQPENPLWDAFPPWFWVLLIQLALAVLLLALWRARRLGPPVSEPLPVTVRAAETVYGRGRLYRRAKARGPTADVLRAAARERIAQLLAPPPGVSLVDATAAATGQDREQVEGLLDGPTPESDDDLRRLQSDLDALVEAVRRAR